MKRRDLIKKAATGAVAGGAVVAAPYVRAASPRLRWRMATSWPISLDTIYGGVVFLAKRVAELTDGRFQIRPYAGGELVGGLQVFDAVQANTVEMGHTASYYYVGKAPALAFDTCLPFGLTFRQQNAWMYYLGGHELMNKTLFSQFNIVSMPAGNTGCQMGGWFRKPVPDLAALKGLKMRIPGFGGKVMAAIGVNVQTLAGSEIYPALERGAIDATEWVGPYDDQKLGFWQVAKYYYSPGWWEPGPQLSVYINKQRYEKLPKEYQLAIRTAAADANQNMMAHYDAVNPPALQQLLAKGVKLERFSKDIDEAAQNAAFNMYIDLAGKDPTWKKIYGEWLKVRQAQYQWDNVAEQDFRNFAFNNPPKRTM